MQELNAVNFQLMWSGLDNDGDREFEAIQQRLQDVNQMLRMMSYDLRPPLLAELGLPAAIRSYAERLQAEDKLPLLHLDLPDGSVSNSSEAKSEKAAGASADGYDLSDEAVTLALYRICQQAVHNAIQHARADQIWVRLAFEPEQTMLEIRDNGRGFYVPERLVNLAQDNHLGVIGMAERAENVGGQFYIASTPGSGTTVCVTVPCR